MGRKSTGSARIYRILEGRSISESEARAMLVTYTISLGWTGAEVVSLRQEPCLNYGSHWNGVVRPSGQYVRPEHRQRRIEWLERKRYRK